MRKRAVLIDYFKKVDKYLSNLEHYWHIHLFLEESYPAFNENKPLIKLLESITDFELKKYQQTPSLFYPLLQQVLPDLLNVDDPLFFIKRSDIKDAHDSLPFWLKRGIKGRKQTQNELFSDCIEGTLPILEWCAGKGHLGRLIHYKTKAEISAVEWNAQLCQIGSNIAEQSNMRQKFIQANVLLGEADHLIINQQHVVALHACGDLHRHLIQHAAQSSDLLSTISLNKQHLKLAVSKQSTSGQRQTRLNDQEVWWRLSFDCLQKRLLSSTDYLNVPSFPKTLLSSTFREFAVWVINIKQLNIDLSEYEDLDYYLDQGRQRFNRLRRAELVTQFFCRPLELWLVYDRAISLQEAGYKVQIYTFCEANVTPRNLLIQATLD